MIKIVCYLCGAIMDADKDDIRTDDETGEDICEICDKNYSFEEEERRNEKEYLFDKNFD